MCVVSGATEPFDVDAFAAGVRAIRETDRTAPSIAAFVDSAACAIAPEERVLLYRDIGGMGTLPVPLTALVPTT
jgi:hypothetical protein